jgi:aspartate/methionine/tyrosine aminotransferase
MLHDPTRTETARPDPIRPAIRTLQPSGITKVTALGLGNPDIIPLWLGETDLVTPPFIRRAAIEALEDGKTTYTNARGITPLRQAIAAFHKRTSGATVDIERITVPGSAMLAVVTALQMCCEAGDNIVIAAPIWPNIFQAARIAGAQPRLVRLDENWQTGKWQLDMDKLFDACDARTKAFFLASPGNPTGWMMSAQEQARILEFSRTRGIAIIADEVYGTLIYDGAPHAPSFLTIADADDALFVINSFSKPWAMTGWRIGWLVHPATLVGAAAGMAQANNTGATHFAQYGALAALSDPQGDIFRAALLERCRAGLGAVSTFLAGQNRIRWMPPQGAFYGFLHVDGLSDSLSFCQRLVGEQKVGVSPGAAFSMGDARDEAFVRICFAQDGARVTEGLARLERGIAAL